MKIWDNTVWKASFSFIHLQKLWLNFSLTYFYKFTTCLRYKPPKDSWVGEKHKIIWKHSSQNGLSSEAGCGHADNTKLKGLALHVPNPSTQCWVQFPALHKVPEHCQEGFPKCRSKPWALPSEAQIKIVSKKKQKRKQDVSSRDKKKIYIDTMTSQRGC